MWEGTNDVDDGAAEFAVDDLLLDFGERIGGESVPSRDLTSGLIVGVSESGELTAGRWVSLRLLDRTQFTDVCSGAIDVLKCDRSRWIVVREDRLRGIGTFTEFDLERLEIPCTLSVSCDF